jgi:hypothetical protein
MGEAFLVAICWLGLLSATHMNKKMRFDVAEVRMQFGKIHGRSRRAISREPGGKGSFQAVKLQRPARTTVCSHSTRDMAAMFPIESEARS